jgi:hypothetical protein
MRWRQLDPSRSLTNRVAPTDPDPAYGTLHTRKEGWIKVALILTA